MDPRGRFYVTVDYDNEIVALAAIRLAERVINALDSKDIAQIDMAREIGRLRELAKLSRRFTPPPTARAARRTPPPADDENEAPPVPALERAREGAVNTDRPPWPNA